MDTRTAQTQPQRRPRSRQTPNVLRSWLESDPRPMSKQEFAEQIGVTASYVSMLLADNAPWPGRLIAQRIGVVSKGAVTPNDLAGYTPGN